MIISNEDLDRIENLSKAISELCEKYPSWICSNSLMRVSASYIVSQENPDISLENFSVILNNFVQHVLDERIRIYE